MDMMETNQLVLELDNLRSQVKSMAENNLNTLHEIMIYKTNLQVLASTAQQVKDRIDSKRSDLKRILAEAHSILKSYCSHLKVMTLDMDKECELDWETLWRGDTETYSDFLESFLDHRKDFHIYRIKAKKLEDDLNSLTQTLASLEV